jgi:hypothetical protein
VGAISEFNQRAYELFARPLMEALSNDYTAKLGREFHPLRFQRWAISDLNPWLWWVKPTADMIRQQRQSLPADHPLRKSEKMMAEITSAALDYYRAIRDAMSEAAFFQIYGNLFSLYLADKHEKQVQTGAADPRELPFVKDALASMDQGGYPEALARVAYLLARKGEPLPLARVQLKQELINDYRDLLPAISMDQARRIRGEQELIVRYEPERAIETLPSLLPERSDRDRLITLLDRLLADERVQNVKPLPEQLAMLERIRGLVSAEGAKQRRRVPTHEERRTLQ